MTAYDEDRLAEDFPEEAHGLSRNACHPPPASAPANSGCGDPLCPTSCSWTVSVGRTAAGGFVYHVINRAVGRAKLFRKAADYAAFVTVMREAQDEVPTRLLGFCLMPNRWHLLLWPHKDGELSRYLHWLTMTHTQRWHAQHHTAGMGPIYQGRFKAFPVQEDDHLWTVWRYVERNALRAELVERAEQWPWCSLALREQGPMPPWLSDGPSPLPRGWLRYVNGVEKAAELEALRRSVVRGSPWGDEQWQRLVVEQLGLETTLRPRGRPRKRPATE